MQIHEHTTPDKLDRYSFIWNEARLVLAAIALFLGGYPLAIRVLPIPLTGSLLTLSWIISGVVSVYLAYRWNQVGKKLFGHDDMKDKVAFFVSVVSGINLGIVGLLGTNIGMSISSSKMVFLLVGIVYLLSSYHLYTRWKAHGEKIF